MFWLTYRKYMATLVSLILATFFFGLFFTFTLLSYSKEAFAKDNRAIIKYEQQGGNRKIRITIDPGHGGRDPGGVGHGLLEKDIALAISKKLKKLLDGHPGFTSFLTRKYDEFIVLDDRAAFAHKHRADLLISIHVNSNINPRPRGASVYIINEKGAKNAYSRYLKQKEKHTQATKIIEDHSSDVQSLIIDLIQTVVQEKSSGIADRILDNFSTFSKIHSDGLHEENFNVLLTSNIPAILVETGFISNVRDARKLGTGSYQQQLAKGIYSAVVEHFKASPPEGTYLEWVKRGGKPKEYPVNKGDTLIKIARSHKVSLSKLKTLNGISPNSDEILAGQILLIP